MYPNFIVIGAAKCGTTSLCDLLAGHPQVFFSEPKEPRYFSDSERYGQLDFRREYESLFASAGPIPLVGEGTTTYTHPKIAAEVADRIATEIPDCKLIFMARHPIRRLESDWRMRCFEGWAPDDINDAVSDNYSLVTHSLFSKNLQPYVDRFPSGQLHTMLLEDLSANPRAAIETCLKFLGADSTVELEDPERRRNASQNFRRDSKLSAGMRKSELLTWVRDLLPAPAVRQLKRLLTRQSPYEPKWNVDCLERVREDLRQDARSFLNLAGKPADFWDLGD